MRKFFVLSFVLFALALLVAPFSAPTAHAQSGGTASLDVNPVVVTRGETIKVHGHGTNFPAGGETQWKLVYLDNNNPGSKPLQIRNFTAVIPVQGGGFEVYDSYTVLLDYAGLTILIQLKSGETIYAARTVQVRQRPPTIWESAPEIQVGNQKGVQLSKTAGVIEPFASCTTDEGGTPSYYWIGKLEIDMPAGLIYVGTQWPTKLCLSIWRDASGATPELVWVRPNTDHIVSEAKNGTYWVLIFSPEQSATFDVLFTEIAVADYLQMLWFRQALERYRPE